MNYETLKPETMKKLIMIIAIGLSVTAAFTQNAKSDFSQTQGDINNVKGVKIKDKLQTKETKSAADYQSTATKKKLNVKKKMVVRNVLMKAK
ncbi:MAG: hypothetical protein ACJATE_000040 [Bacteroidia bacterium]